MMGQKQQRHCKRPSGANMLVLCKHATTFSRHPNLLARQRKCRYRTSSKLEGLLMYSSHASTFPHPIPPPFKQHLSPPPKTYRGLSHLPSRLQCPLRQHLSPPPQTISPPTNLKPPPPPWGGEGPKGGGGRDPSAKGGGGALGGA